MNVLSRQDTKTFLERVINPFLELLFRISHHSKSLKTDMSVALKPKSVPHEFNGET